MQILCQDIKMHVSYNLASSTVPALSGPRRKRPPTVCGQLINVPTPFNVKLPAIRGHLPKADENSHLLVVRTCYNGGQCKQMQCFRWSFQPKLAGSHPNLRSTLRSKCSVLPSGDHKQYFISRVYACVMSHVISASER